MVGYSIAHCPTIHRTHARTTLIGFCRAMRCISAAYAVMRCPTVCLSVCVSVTFVSCVKTNKDIFEIFPPSGSQAILVFPAEQDGDIPTGTPLTELSNEGGAGKKRDSGRNLASLHTGIAYSVVNRTSREV